MENGEDEARPPKLDGARSDQNLAPPPEVTLRIHPSSPSEDESSYSGTFVFDIDGEGVVDFQTLRADSNGYANDQLAAVGVGVPADVPGRGWVMLDKVAAGAMGEVVRARDRDLNRTEAAKIMGKDIADVPMLAAKFFGEAQITAQLEHPSIVPIYSLERSEDGRLAYTMRMVDGITLEQWLQDTLAMPEHSDAAESRGLFSRLEMFLKICDGVQYAHHRGVLHRDLKPANVMIGTHGEVYVMDWGIAELMAGKQEQGLNIEGHRDADTLIPGTTKRRQVVGTPGYMSPEQAIGAGDLDGRSDVYASGLILQELLTLQPAVASGNIAQRLERNQQGERDDRALVNNKSISPELVAIVERATQLDRERRYAGMGDFGEDIRRYTRGDQTLALPDGYWQAVVRWVGKNRGAVAVFILLLIMVSAMKTTWEAQEQLRMQETAAAHERVETLRVATVAGQAARIDGRFVRLEGLLEWLSASVATRIRIEPYNAAGPYFIGAFQGQGVPPPGLAMVPSYEHPVSFAHPVFLYAGEGGVDADIQKRALRISGMRDEIRRLMLRSAGHDVPQWAVSRQAQLLAEDGVPLTWVSIAFEDGLHMSFPGHGAFPAGYDPRERPWYRLGAENTGPTWGAPYVDSASGRLILPCSAPIMDGSVIQGVTAAKLSFDSIIGDLLQTEAGEAMIVDGDGRIVIRGGDAGDVREMEELNNRALSRIMLPYPSIIERIRELQSGSELLTVQGRRTRVVYHQLRSLGWYFIVVEPE